ncbi:ribose-phosphate diphosphokinase [Candidatus Contubernalis alkaliaceticus]|uniref:ribose-phosphate diphosphokinase n=1 Tax=Candidatus Contubernalis alkaliaceticus TaxID=338645 RepID=UPI001F4BF46F|nr:ribose-phosphate pyrophosphokinase [Candidatus Contubernalis alkalaceticus]UNC90698.1 ribose-phosphate pyrophosphokinase [Candidatus Contubernalis alkalaceticus]
MKSRGSKKVYPDKKLKIFTGTANIPLAEEIAQHIGIPLGKGEIQQFCDGEITSYIGESVRGADVYVVQPLAPPTNDNIMELLIMIDAIKRASAKSINAVIPYFGYARQDRKTRARDPITAKLMADLITTSGAHRVITMDLHAGQIQGFFNIPVDHLPGVPIIAKYFNQKQLDSPTVVSPDLGGVTRARKLADYLNCPIAIIDKRRPEPNVSEVMNIIGKVENRTVIMIDDIIDTAGTIVHGAMALMEQGAKEIYVCCTHAILSGPAKERLESANIKEVVVTNSIQLMEEKMLPNIRILSVAPLIGDAIIRIHEELSVSKLFD